MTHTSFRILDHLDQLNIVKETRSEYHCTCPVCQDGGFKIDKRSGKYHTFKCGCMDTAAGKKAVIRAIAPFPLNPMRNTPHRPSSRLPKPPESAWRTLLHSTPHHLPSSPLNPSDLDSFGLGLTFQERVTP